MGKRKELFISKDERAKVFGSEILVKQKDGEVVKKPISALDGKYIGVYFCRHDSPPCKKFTPHLKAAYAALKAEDKPFEVLVIISDKELYKLYHEDQPWAGVVGPASHRAQLCKTFHVSSVPALVIISPEGDVVAWSARAALLENPKGFPWEGSTEPGESYWPAVQNMVAVFIIFIVVSLILFAHTYLRMSGDTDGTAATAAAGAAAGLADSAQAAAGAAASQVLGAGLDGEL